MQDMLGGSLIPSWNGTKGKGCNLNKDYQEMLGRWVACHRQLVFLGVEAFVIGTIYIILCMFLQSRTSLGYYTNFNLITSPI